MAPSRRTRGADHYGHGYDEGHDDHSIGFPSIEGALMAISFLTFAVYLVRLVMVRNIAHICIQNVTFLAMSIKCKSTSLGLLSLLFSISTKLRNKNLAASL